MKSKIKKRTAFIMAFCLSMPAVTAFGGETTLSLEKVSGYTTGTQNPDGGVMEIISYNPANNTAYAVNGQSGKLAVIPLDTKSQLTAEEFDVQTAVTAEGFTYGDMTSVCVSPDGTRLAVAIQALNYADNGNIAVFTCNSDGSIDLEKVYEAGVQPDMVVFSGNDTILTANEGEPREGYLETSVDPMGSVSVVDIATSTSSIVDFTAFDSQRDNLISKSIILKKNTLPSVDFEPEYIAVSEGIAYVTLQEANAVAVLDIENKAFTDIYSLSFEDYSRVTVDIDKKDGKYAPALYESLRGIRMPDGISAFKTNGKTYLVTANEGDSREWGTYLNEDERNFGKGKTSPSGAITPENSGITGKVVFFDQSDYDGLDQNTDYLFGGRSFTVFEVTENGLTQIFTSGDDCEEITAKLLPEHFNCSNDDMTIDDRSGKKGPEPESVTIGTVDDKTYAFIALERISGVMAYDITDPDNITYAGYINSREFTDHIAGDVAPEGLAFISADKNAYGKCLLLAACEVSGTVAVYTAEHTTTEILSGDADNDGIITAKDASEVLTKTLSDAYVTNLEKAFPDTAFKYMDVNSDGILTATDAADILAIALK